jgi:hypothetical protein
VRIGRLAQAGWLRRLGRRLWMGNNRLRRRVDRIEAWITGGLIAVFLVGAPLSWFGAGRWAQQAALREQRAQQQSWHRVPAVVLKGAPPQPQFEFGLPWSTEILVLARWAGPGGKDRVGEVPVKAGTAAGRTVQVWVDSSGRPTGPPMLHSELVKRVIGTEMLAPPALAVLLLSVAWLVRWVMDRRRLAGWEAGWASIGPRWTQLR